MVQLVGILLIINGLIVTAWLLNSGRSGVGSAVILCFVALFAGIVLIIHERIIEVTVKGVGTIKAATEQAMMDAEEISTIKQRIEAQSAIVDLVAREAGEAKSLVDQVSRSPLISNGGKKKRIQWNNV
ncbi:MAG: hypothetical protein JRI22_21285 [Deltaproteobacteria bacterium]|nr:hypothetical protein [Deltaproteobacteria bacterium]